MIAVVVVLILVAAFGLYYYVSQSKAASTSSSTSATTVAGPPQKVSLMLDFSPNSYHAPFYYGVQQNYFNDDGVALTIVPGTGSSATIAAVSAGEVQFGLADAAGLVYARHNANISNVVMVAMIFEKNFYAIIYNKQSITSIGEIAGQPGGATNNSTSTQTKLFYLLAKLDGINITKTNISYTSSADYSTETAELAEGKLQWILDPEHDLPVLQADAATEGIQLGSFPFAENGLNTYGEALITTTTMVQKDPALVQEMVRATMQSVIATIEDPSVAINALVASQPQLNATLSLQGYEDDISCCLATPTAGMNPLTFGWINSTLMQNTVSLVAEGLGVSTPLNASSFYTDQFTVQP